MKVCLILVAVIASCVAQAPPGWHPSGRALLLPTRIQEEPTTPAPQPNNTQSDEKESKRILDSGEYYVLLEDGRLQMVKYVTAELKEQDEVQAKNQQPQQNQQNKQYKQQDQQYQQASKTQYPVYQQAQNYQQHQPSQQNQQYKQQPQQYQKAPKNQFISYQQPQQYFYSQQNSNLVSDPSSTSQRQSNPEPFAKFQVEYVQYPTETEFSQTKLQPTASETNVRPETEKEDTDDSEINGYEAKVQYRDVKPISAPIYAYNPTPLVRILKK